ncbi:MAG: glycosyltransferase family 4 protein [Candidatus Lokiarchaeia archaeon]
MHKYKIALIIPSFPPYRIPLLNLISANKDIDFYVICLCRPEKKKKWKVNYSEITFSYTILPGICFFIKKYDWWIHINWGLLKTINKFNPDIIIAAGYDSLASWESFIFCKIRKKPFILWNETTTLSVRSMKGLIRFIKRIIVANSDICIASGKKAKEYLLKFGVDEEKIICCINTLDSEKFYKRAWEYRKSINFNIERRKYPHLLLLFVGRLIKKKNVFTLLKAIEKLNDRDIGLLIIGNGLDKEHLKKYCAANNLKNVYFEGFKQQEELPKYYALADAFVLPSIREEWGLVVNEALSTGLYILCSNIVGSSYDLIKENWNGILFEPSNINELADSIKKIKRELDEIHNRRLSISEIMIKNFSPNKAAECFLSAIKNSIEKDDKI